MEALFRDTPGFGDVCKRMQNRYPSAQTLNRADIRPGNVKLLKNSSGLNAKVHQIQLNWTALRKVMIETDRKLEDLTKDGTEWLLNSYCKDDHVLGGIFL